MSEPPVELQNVAKIPEGKSGVDNTAFDKDDTHHAVVDGKSPGDVYVNVNVNDQHNGTTHRSPNGPTAEDPTTATTYSARPNHPEDNSDLSGCSSSINTVQQAIVNFFVTHKTIIIRVILVILLLLYLAGFGYAMHYEFGNEASVRLLVCTVLGLFILVWSLSSDRVAGRLSKLAPKVSDSKSKRVRTIIKWLLYVASVVAIVTLLIVLVAMDTPENLISLAGLAGFIIVCWITSVNPARVNWHPVFWGFSLQFYFAVIILKTRWGYESFKWLGDRVTEFLSYSDEGAAFLFGSNFRVHFFAFAILPVIVFFSSVISVLYYIGVMQGIVRVIGRFLSFCMGTTPAESLNAAGNIFVGMSEAPLMIRPFIATMTKSELHAVMTGGFATIAGAVLGAYIGFGVPANHLLSASVMSAPAALAISKLTYPETEETHVDVDDYAKMEKGAERNLIEAVSAGASSAISLVANVAVNVLAFLSILKFVNVTLTWFGERVGVEDLTFQLICSYVLYPVSLFMGTEPGLDCRRLGELVGIKTFTNEFIAYQALRDLLHNREVWKNYTLTYDVSNPANVAYDDLDVNLTQWNMVLKKGFLSPRSEVIATYALCGFSNFGSMGILLGAMTAMAPHRRADLASIIFRAMIAGNVASFLTACIAGLFFEDFE